MRTKTFVLFLMCVIATSVLLILVGNKRPTIESIVSETHKQLHNLKTFKENLENAEEKRLVADDKYLTLLGFVERPRQFPGDVWRNTSLPIIITYSNVWSVVQVRDGQEQQGVGLARNTAHFLPNHTTLIYNLGVSQYGLQMLQANCNSSRCVVVNFDLELFPSHVEEDRLHAYRPLVIQVLTALAATSHHHPTYLFRSRPRDAGLEDALNKAGVVLFLECDHRLVSGQLEPLVKQATEEGGVVSWATYHPTSSLTHPKMFDYFQTTAESFLFLPMVEASALLLVNVEGVHTKIMLPWVQCALTQDCILPIGAQSGGCRFNKKPQYRYSGCHRYDGSALNIVLGLYFGFDEKRYTCKGKERYFRRVAVETAAAEMAGLEGNATEATSISKDFSYIRRFTSRIVTGSDESARYKASLITFFTLSSSV
uniref:Uncharacterized protein n=1 Tax=Timema poppense TaxID=170557 RepID=A0A7R9D3I2_TIMPO|nr:unnamed protein product [Timema poppensis]